MRMAGARKRFGIVSSGRLPFSSVAHGDAASTVLFNTSRNM
jgi:hypothetical protein